MPGRAGPSGLVVPGPDGDPTSRRSCGTPASQAAQRGGRSRQELAAAGILVQLWRVTGQRANVGIWNAPAGDALHEALEYLPCPRFSEFTWCPWAGTRTRPR
jgi:muconolactone delta-isomerase